MEKLYTLNTWTGGISNDEYIGQSGSFYNGQGCEIRQNSRQIYLGQAAEEENIELGADTQGIITTFVSDSASGSSKGFVGCKNGYIWSLKTSPSLLYTKSTGETTSSIINIVPYSITDTSGSPVTTAYVLIGQTKVSRFNYTSTPTIANFTNDFETLSSSASSGTNYRPVLLKDGYCYIGNGRYIDKLDNTGAIPATPALTLPSSDVIKGLVQIGDQILIYTQDKTYYWNGTETTPGRTVNWYNLTIDNVVNYAGTNIVVCHNTTYTYLYQTDGYNRQLVYRGTNDSSNSGRNDFVSNYTNAIESDDNMVFIPNGNGNNIFTYGFFHPGFAKSLNKDFQYGVSNEATALLNDGKYMYVGYQQSSKNKFSTFNFTNTAKKSGGYIETNPLLLDGDGQAVAFRLNYLLQDSSCQIKIYSKINDATSYTLIATLDGANTDYLNNRKYTYMYDSVFNKIQFKIELINGGNTQSPYVSSFIFKYQDINDDLN